MNGRIDKDGVLWIERRRKMKKMRCRMDPYAAAPAKLVQFNNGSTYPKEYEPTYCMDDCPLFGDRALVDRRICRACGSANIGNMESCEAEVEGSVCGGFLEYVYELQICQGRVLVFEKLEVET